MQFVGGLCLEIVPNKMLHLEGLWIISGILVIVFVFEVEMETGARARKQKLFLGIAVAFEFFHMYIFDDLSATNQYPSGPAVSGCQETE